LSCAEKRVLIDGFLDGELDAVRSLEIEAHLKACPSCSRLLESHGALRYAINAGSLAYRAPAKLERSIRAALPQEVRPVRTGGVFPWRWLSLAASAAFALALAWGLAQRVATPSAEELLAREAVSSHVRSLMAAHLTDVTSTDQHTVKPWFDGKLDFAPPVHDFAEAGFPLLGGRLDYLNGRPVAALVYQRRKHFINLFIWPANDAGDAAEKAATQQGYNILHWRQAGMNFWAVSDVNAADLAAFAGLTNR